jgi:hypothetical protein
LVSVILADIIPLRQRAQYQAITSLAWSFSVITGMLSLILATHRLIFLLVVISSVLLYFWLRLRYNL